MDIPAFATRKQSKRITLQSAEFFRNNQEDEKLAAHVIANFNNSTSPIEKISLFRLSLVVLYTISLMVVLNLRINFSKLCEVNTALNQVYLNQLKVGEKFITPDPLKTSLRDVNDMGTMVNFINSFIESIYQDDQGNLILGNKTSSDIMHYEVITPLRILQTRAQIIQQPENQNFPVRLDLDESLENTTQYGNQSFRFTYNAEEGGFKLNFMLPFWSYNQTHDMFSLAVTNGYFDNQTREVQVDFTQYNSNNNFVNFMKLNFFVHPTGAITTKSETTSYPKGFYEGKEGKVLLSFQIIFLILFVYFLFQEFIKIYTQIRNAAPVAKKSDDNKNVMAQVAAQALSFKQKIATVFKGLFNHLKNVWSFLDVISLTCSLIDIILWIKVFRDDTPERILSFTSQTSQLSTEERMANLENSNYLLDWNTYFLIIFRHFAGVNVMILVLKMLKYVAALNEQMKMQVEILTTATDRLITFVILLVTIMFMFVYASYFIYGDTIEEFSNFFSIFRYFVTNIQKNYSKADMMLSVNQALTIIFHILFIFIVIFIFTNMFVVYIIHAYTIFLEAHKEKKRLAQANGEMGIIEPHFFWKFKKFFSVTICLFMLKVFNRKKYEAAKLSIHDQERRERKEQVLVPGFLFNHNIDDKSDEKDKLNPIFNTEDRILKLKTEKKIKRVRRVWKIAFMIVSFVVLTIVVMDHHKVPNAEAMYRSINKLFEEEDVRVSMRSGALRVYNFAKSVRYLQNMQEVLNWLNKMFSYYVIPDSLNFTDGKSISGNFIAGNNFLLTNTVRLTIRKRSHIALSEEMYRGANQQMLSPLFDATDVNPTGELKTPIVGKVSGKIYNYTEDNGYQKSGGYVIESSLENFRKTVSEIIRDGNVIDSDCSSVVLDFVLYQTIAENAMNVDIVFQMNAGSSLDVKINLDFVCLDSYNQSGQYVIAVIECLTIIWVIAQTYRTYRRIRVSNYQYNYWYSLYIAIFPEPLKKMREKKEPEFFRKAKYLFKFNIVIDIILICFITASIILRIVFLASASKSKKVVMDFLHGANSSSANADLLYELDTDFNILFALRIIESLALVVLSIKILYNFSYFGKFRFLAETFKNITRWFPQMLVILFFVLLAFGFFMQFVKGTSDKNYSDFWSLLAKQLENFTRIDTKDTYALTGLYSLFITLIYYFPWVLIATCVLYNMFLGAVFTAYQSRIHKESHDDAISIIDFCKLTTQLLRTRKKPKKQNQRVHYEVTEQTRGSFKFRKVFDELRDPIHLPDSSRSFKDGRLWATVCVKGILNESKGRKTMKEVSKEIARASVIDFDFEKIQHKKILLNHEKLSQFILKLKFWKYFAYGQKKTLEYMDTFEQGMEYNRERLGDVRSRRLHKKVDSKIMQYIAQLEQQISRDVNEIQQI